MWRIGAWHEEDERHRNAMGPSQPVKSVYRTQYQNSKTGRCGYNFLPASNVMYILCSASSSLRLPRVLSVTIRSTPRPFLAVSPSGRARGTYYPITFSPAVRQLIDLLVFPCGSLLSRCEVSYNMLLERGRSSAFALADRPPSHLRIGARRDEGEVTVTVVTAGYSNDAKRNGPRANCIVFRTGGNNLVSKNYAPLASLRLE